MQHYWESSQSKYIAAIAFTELLLLGAAPMHAQLIPDQTLGTESSQVVPYTTSEGTTQSIIEQGAIRGNNLFHSLAQFDIPTGETAYFANPAGISHIFTRITGADASRLDGSLGVLGDANLFLLNPHGLLFGPNARLDLAGSFLGTTAEQVQFADGINFSAAQPNSDLPLTVSLPMGLQMGAQSGEIQVQGTGHRLTAPDPYVAPYIADTAYAGLEVQPQQTLALVGRDLRLTGGVLQAPGGRIELGAVAQSGWVGLQGLLLGGPLSYEAIQQFGAIELTQKASLETGGFLPGHIHLQGGAIHLRDAAVIANENLGPSDGGTVTIHGMNSIDLSGLDFSIHVPTQIRQDNFGSGQGGAIMIRSPLLALRSGASLASRNYGDGIGGNLYIDSGVVEIQGAVEQAPEAFTRVATITTASGQGGDLTVSATDLTLTGGGFLGSGTLLDGLQGGNVWIDSDRVKIQGSSSAGIRSGIGANHLSRSGRSGNLTLNTQQLEIVKQGFVATTSISAGDAGDLTVNASEFIHLTGQGSTQTQFPAAIASNVNLPSPVLQQLFSLPTVPTGSGGNLRIRTPRLLVEQGAVITVDNSGLGRAGGLELEAGNVLLRDNALISALTLSGDGGNLAITAERLALLNESAIVAAALGEDNSGNGGNISIDASLLLGAKDSDIVASAQQGRGGNITITTEGLFGLEFRPQETPDNDINASSGLGLNGMVQVETLTLKPTPSRIELEQTPIDMSQLIVAGCSLPAASQFTLSGKGGLPVDPRATLTSRLLWQDTNPPPHATQVSSKSSHQHLAQAAFPQEATTWQPLASGKTQLLAQGNVTAAPNRGKWKRC